MFGFYLWWVCITNGNQKTIKILCLHHPKFDWIVIINIFTIIHQGIISVLYID